MALQWTTNMTTGVEVIDLQHRELFNRINAIFDSCNKGNSREEVVRVIDFLDGYIVSHFETEENLQRRHNYPEYTAHKTAHEEFKKEFLRLKQAVEATGITFHTVVITSKLLSDWWIQHINNLDKKLGIFLKDKML